MFFYNKTKKFKADQENVVTSCMEFIEEALKKIGTDRKLMLKTLLLAEESVVQMIEHADEGAFVSIRIKKVLGDAQVNISSPGKEYDPFRHSEISGSGFSDMEEEEASEAARAILLKAQGERLKFSNRRGRNSVRILSGQSEKSQLIHTFAALVTGLLFGVFVSEVLSEQVSSGLCTYVLVPVKTMFMNALKIIIAPVVFFSIVSCISQFKDIAELGRIGAKVMGMYLFTTVAAVSLSIGVALLFHPGDYGFALNLSGTVQNVEVDTNVDTSLLNTIVNIVPSNFVRPFLESDTL